LPACEDVSLGAEEYPLLSQFRVAVVRSEKLVAEAGDSSGTQMKRNVHCWKTLPSSAVKIVKHYYVCDSDF
jgi:hypothetical protein